MTSERVSFLFWFYLFDLNHQPPQSAVRRLLIWEGVERWRCQIQRDGCPPVRGMSRSDKGYAVSGEERMTHERTRDALACRSTRRFAMTYASWFKYAYICLYYTLIYALLALNTQQKEKLPLSEELFYCS